MQILKAFSLVLVSSVATGATAQSFDFSAPVVTSATKGPGVWYTDRYAPAGFQTSGGKLIETIAQADHQTPGTPPSIGFYNTQGRAYDLDGGVTRLSIDLTLDRSWANTAKRWAGLWGFGVPADGSSITAYPELEFTTDGGARFRGFDSNTGAWYDLLPTGGITFGNTYNLSITLADGLFTYAVGGAAASYAANGSTAMSTVVLQGYNTGTPDFSITWDNLNATGAVPESASWAMMVAGFGLVGAALRRRRLSVAFS